MTIEELEKRSKEAKKGDIYFVGGGKGGVGKTFTTIALVDALEHGKLGGAGLDVFEGEPNIAADPAVADRLRKLQNVVLTPHTASATLTTRVAMSKQVVKNIEEFLAGEVPENAIKI